jgi:hypothetical protein
MQKLRGVTDTPVKILALPNVSIEIVQGADLRWGYCGDPREPVSFTTGKSDGVTALNHGCFSWIR